MKSIIRMSASCLNREQKKFTNHAYMHVLHGTGSAIGNNGKKRKEVKRKGA